jgi:hypothetical protein
VAQKKRNSLRPDTTLAPVGELKDEVYVSGLPGCCLAAFKQAIMEVGDPQLLELRCSCGRSWQVTSSLDHRVLWRFRTHQGPRVEGGTYPAA